MFKCSLSFSKSSKKLGNLLNKSMLWALLSILNATKVIFVLLMPTSFVSSHWFRFLFPIGLLIAIMLGMENVILITSANIGFASNLPYILFTVAIALGHIFKQGRLAMISTAMMVAYAIIQWRLQMPLSTGTTLLELSLLSLLLPVLCLVPYALGSNATVLSKTYGLYIAILLLLMFWAVVTLMYVSDGGFENFSQVLLVTIPKISKLPFLLVMYLLALIGVSSIFVLTRNQILDTSIYASILLSSVTFIFFHVSYISSTLFSLAGVLLILYLISAGHKMAFIDRLTGIPGRHALDLDIKYLGKKYAIAMLDIDHFKQFNDRYGHDTGDDVLKLIASRLLLTQGNARVYRYGGEEFTILFKGKNAQQAAIYLDLLRKDIEQYQMVIRNAEDRPKDDKLGSKKREQKTPSNLVSITVSIGVADSYTSEKPEAVLKIADQALYKAKQNGRNRVEV
ncbi:GGDEF domain-containing protein [Vibrio anguillarum]|uniref:GGDEF domain-containing protein n=1 Tax=Vibrio anguillarum TaxID=55601 RepID=UPI00188BFF4E|nr:GGDEF domain-containing protein [Vibrio anguillarum]MBF4385373.1 GGDEF domain-containing protein [Vibrio anguillarum]MBF4393807.1 GGDEF domain-containing protein [Vibrio anguillarum]MBF4431240.1 GGDEF domain-containing protein [Vibrio anguillarum]